MPTIIDGAALTFKCLQRSVLGRGLVLVCQPIIEPTALTFKCIDGRCSCQLELILWH